MLNSFCTPFSQLLVERGVGRWPFGDSFTSSGIITDVVSGETKVLTSPCHPRLQAIPRRTRCLSRESCTLLFREASDDFSRLAVGAHPTLSRQPSRNILFDESLYSIHARLCHRHTTDEHQSPLCHDDRMPIAGMKCAVCNTSSFSITKSPFCFRPPLT